MDWLQETFIENPPNSQFGKGSYLASILSADYSKIKLSREKNIFQIYHKSKILDNCAQLKENLSKKPLAPLSVSNSHTHDNQE
jgi:hypothetical protein